MRYGFVLGLALSAAVSTTAAAEITREQCLELLSRAVADKEPPIELDSVLSSRFLEIGKMDSADSQVRELQDATFDFGEQIYAHIARYTAAVSDLCRDKL